MLYVNVNMDFDEDLYSHSIVRIPCPHCGELCSTLAKNCPKCGEHLNPTLKRINKEKLDELIAIKSSELQIIGRLEKVINKSIPKVEKLERNIIGYISDSENLTGISLFNCGLATIPEELMNLTNLKFLYLRRNSINSLQKSIGFLSALEEMDLSINELSILPKSIGLLKSLRKLNLSSNKLLNIPDTIGTISNLEVLNLSNNRLKNIPISLNKLAALKELNLKANFWITIHDSIIQQKERGLRIDM